MYAFCMLVSLKFQSYSPTAKMMDDMDLCNAVILFDLLPRADIILLNFL